MGSKKKSATSVMVGLLIAATALSGCSSNNNANNNASGNANNAASKTANNTASDNTSTANTADNDSSGATATANDAADNKVYAITWHGSFQLDNLVDDSEVKQALEQKFNVKLHLVNAKTDKLNLLAASNDLPDVIRIADPKDISTLATSGQLLAINQDDVKANMPHIADSIASTSDSLWGLTKVDGSYYAIPEYLSVVPWDTAITWRKDILDLAGIARTPVTIADYDAAFKAIADHKKDIVAKTNPKLKNLYMFTSSLVQYSFQQFTWLFGAYGSMPGSWQLDANGNVVRGETLPGTKDALVKLNEWYKAGYIDPAFVTDKGEQETAKYNTGEYAFKMRGFNEISNTNPDDLQKAFPSVQYANAKVPAGPSGAAGVWSWGKRQNFVGLNAKLKDDPGKVKKIMQILDTIASDDQLYLLTHYGIEGKSYNLVNGVPTAIPPYDKADSPESLALGVGQEANDGTVYGAFGAADIVQKYMDPNLVSEWKDKAAGMPDVIFGMPLPSSGDVEQRLIDKWTETMIKIVSGQAPLSAYDDYLTWMDANGGKQLTKEANDLYQAQFKQ